MRSLEILEGSRQGREESVEFSLATIIVSEQKMQNGNSQFLASTSGSQRLFLNARKNGLFRWRGRRLKIFRLFAVYKDAWSNQSQGEWSLFVTCFS